MKELGLILFVFCIGLQLGPGFFASLRQMGLRLNVLAGTVVVLRPWWRSDSVGCWASTPPRCSACSPATTNTPSLGAAQQTPSALPGISEERAVLPALAYAVSYPVAIIGIIATTLILQMLRPSTWRAAEAFASEQRKAVEPLEQRTLLINNPNLEGITIDSVPGLTEHGVVVSRIRRRGETEVQIATGSSLLHQGDLILAVGTARNLDQCQRIVGPSSSENLMEAAGPSLTAAWW